MSDTGATDPTPPGSARLFHLALPEDWEAAQVDGRYPMSTRGATLAEVGFVHCSFAEQVAATAARFYGDLEEVVVLEIDPARTGAELRVEDTLGTGETFPHLYGPLPVDAVVSARRCRPDEAAPA